MHVLLNPIGAVISRPRPKILAARSQAIRGKWDEGVMKVEFLDNLALLTVGGDITHHSSRVPAAEAE